MYRGSYTAFLHTLTHISWLFSGTKPKATNANFDDLLSGQGFSGVKEKKGPKTIAEMRKEEMAKEMDPEKLKVRKKTPGLIFHFITEQFGSYPTELSGMALY